MKMNKVILAFFALGLFLVDPSLSVPPVLTKNGFIAMFLKGNVPTEPDVKEQFRQFIEQADGWELLGIFGEAPLNHRKLAKVWHPDKQPGANKELSDLVMKKINVANEAIIPVTALGRIKPLERLWIGQGYANKGAFSEAYNWLISAATQTEDLAVATKAKYELGKLYVLGKMYSEYALVWLRDAAHQNDDSKTKVDASLVLGNWLYSQPNKKAEAETYFKFVAEKGDWVHRLRLKTFLLFSNARFQELIFPLVEKLIVSPKYVKLSLGAGLCAATGGLTLFFIRRVPVLGYLNTVLVAALIKSGLNAKLLPERTAPSWYSNPVIKKLTQWSLLLVSYIVLEKLFVRREFSATHKLLGVGVFSNSGQFSGNELFLS